MNIKCNCSYCSTRTYAWLVDNSKVWVEIPKNASALIKSQVYRNQMQILRYDDLKDYENGFLFLRNPIDRFKSLLAHYFLKGGIRYHHGVNWLNLTNIKIGVTNENIAKVVLDNFDKINLISEPHHWNTQYSFIPKTFFLLDFNFYDLSEVSKVFGIDKKQNTSDSFNIVLSNDDIQLINEYYKEDFILYDKYIKKS